MTDLGTFNGSPPALTAINNAGQVIGHYYGRGGQDRAFVANMAGVAPNNPVLFQYLEQQPVDATGGAGPTRSDLCTNHAGRQNQFGNKQYSYTATCWLPVGQSAAL